MSTIVSDITRVAERIAPRHHAYADDRIGHQVGDPSQVVKKCVVTFDISLAAIEFAASQGAQCVVSHHPLIWHPLTHLTGQNYTERRVMKLMQNGIAHIAAHTNWDACPGGLNDFLAEQLGLINIAPMGTANPREVFKLVAFVPVDSAGALFDALSGAGAGQVGNYDRCGFSVDGTGRFRPLQGANPAVGSVGADEFVAETRLEMLVTSECVAAVERALRANHPYEEPAYEFVALRPMPACAISRIGDLPKPVALSEFLDKCRTTLKNRCECWGDANSMIQRVAVCGGAADDEWRAAREAGAQAFVTGEVRQHNGLEAADSGFALIAAGHYATEHPSMERLCAQLARELPGVEWVLFEPSPGQAGRPL